MTAAEDARRFHARELRRAPSDGGRRDRRRIRFAEAAAYLALAVAVASAVHNWEDETTQDAPVTAADLRSVVDEAIPRVNEQTRNEPLLTRHATFISTVELVSLREELPGVRVQSPPAYSGEVWYRTVFHPDVAAGDSVCVAISDTAIEVSHDDDCPVPDLPDAG